MNVFVIEPIRYDVVGRRRARRGDVRDAEHPLPDDLAVAEDAGRDRRHALLRLRRREQAVELGDGERLRRGHSAPSASGTSSSARSMSASSRSRWVTARMCGRAVGRREPDARVPEGGEHVGPRQVEPRGVDLDEVRLDPVELDRDARRVPALGEPPGPLVVDGEPLDVVVEGVERGGGDHAGLAHRTAEEELLPPGDLHQVGGAGEHRPERAAEPLREAQRDGVDPRADRCGGHAERDGGVHQPRAVQVHAEPAGPGGGDDGVELVERPHAAAGDVVGVLEHEHGGTLVDDVLRGRRGGTHLGRA